jgi:hypothetical protein
MQDILCDPLDSMEIEFSSDPQSWSNLAKRGSQQNDIMEKWGSEIGQRMSTLITA